MSAASHGAVMGDQNPRAGLFAAGALALAAVLIAARA
jgi:hypothetical protein